MKKYLVLLLVLLFACEKSTDKRTNEYFIFEPDERLFTAYAFMNAAGFDSDWNKTMHPIRTDVRTHLDSVLNPEYITKIEKFYKSKGGGRFYSYGVYSLYSEQPPEFVPVCDTCQTDVLTNFSGLDSLLAEFYYKAEVGKLFKRHKNQIREMNLKYKPYAELALKHITDYCRVDSNYYRNIATGNFYYQIMPLMSYFTAFFLEAGNDYWIISGPSDGEPGPGGFYHESLHRVINPIVFANEDLYDKVAPLLPLAQETLQGNYNDVSSLLCESFVRAIDMILVSEYYGYDDTKLKELITNEYKLGHILTLYLYEKLPDYRASGKTLEEYYPILINGIDVKKEKLRWNKFKNNK